MIRGFLNDESGATAIEYGLLVALLALACLVALEALGTTIKGFFFETVAQELKNAAGG